MERLEEPWEETPSQREGNYLWFPLQLLVPLAEKLPNTDVFPAVGPSSDRVVILEQGRVERRTRIRGAVRCQQETNFFTTWFVPHIEESVEFLKQLHVCTSVEHLEQEERLTCINNDQVTGQ